MTTSRISPEPDDNADSGSSPDDGRPGETPGAEIGISEGEGSSFEPEEDPED
jgi:hypothetical protein